MRKLMLLGTTLLLVIGLSFAVSASCGCKDWSEFTLTKKGSTVYVTPEYPEMVSQFSYSFGDGRNYSTFNKSRISHTYKRSGWYEIQLKAENQCGRWRKTTKRVRIESSCCEPKVTMEATCGGPCSAGGLLAFLIFFSLLS